MFLTEEPKPALLKPLNIRKREDLVAFRRLFGGQAYWRIKDPVAFEYFQLRDEEYAILQMLDGKTSMGEIQERFERLFAPSHLEIPQLQAFLRRLNYEGLVITGAFGQTGQLLERHYKKERGKLLRFLLNPLAIRTKGIDPERFLNAIYPFFRWIFSAWFLVPAAMLVIAALVMVIVQADAVVARLPELKVFFAGENIIWLGVTLMCVKTIHELAHALTCKHFGGECHQIGFMLLVFTPCLYCNVSDAWMMGSRWHRIAISLAGIAVELVLASACTFLWWFSEPGLLNTIFLNVMFVGSVSTVLFNANPLLRYDGYYVLSDLVEEPNLAEHSTKVVKQRLNRWVLGRDEKKIESTSLSRTLFLIVYGISSNLYRWFIVLSILWFAQARMREMQLGPIAHVMAALAIIGLLRAPVTEIAVTMNSPSRNKKIPPRQLAVLAVVASVFIGSLCIPFPMRIEATAVTQPNGARHIYVPVAGRLAESRKYGETVQEGEVIAQLESDSLAREILELEGSYAQAILHLKNLESRRSRDKAAEAEIPTARGMAADLERRLQQRRSDMELLTLKSPISGTLLPPPPNRKSGNQRKLLRGWTGVPLASRNQGTWFDEGTLLGVVGDQHSVQVDLLIPQNAVEFVRANQRVKISLDQDPLSVFTGTIEEISAFVMEDMPDDSAVARVLPVKTLPNGAPELAETYYLARARLSDSGKPLVIRSLGRAKITVDAMSIGARTYRFLRETFRVE